jgi:hypothetical protein
MARQLRRVEGRFPARARVLADDRAQLVRELGLRDRPTDARFGRLTGRTIGRSGRGGVEPLGDLAHLLRALGDALPEGREIAL